MSQDAPSDLSQIRPVPVVLAIVYFFYVTVILRTLAEARLLADQLQLYLALEILFGFLFTLVLWRPLRPKLIYHLYFLFQSALTLGLLVPYPRLDFFNILLVILSFQAALFFRGRVRWSWVVTLVLLIIMSLTILLGAYGLALSLLSAAAALVFPAYVVVNQEIEAVLYQRQTLLDDLKAANKQLSAYADQVDEFSALQERNRLARELHDSVSQTIFSIGLHSRSARILLERSPERLEPQLEHLQVLTHNALEEMRGLIVELRPQESGSGESPTP